MTTLRASLVSAILAVLVIACSPASGAPIPTPSPAGGGLVIAAEGMRFDRATLEVPADEPFTLAFDNRDAAPHNVAIYVDDSFATPVFQGEIVSRTTVTYAVPAVESGTYVFACDLHKEMRGTITAR